MRFGTAIIHNGNEIDKITGALSIPIYNASTYDQDIDSTEVKYDYSRSGNPTRDALESTIATLERGTRGFAFSSGMAAIASVFSLFSAGDHILITRDVYGGTFRAATKLFNKYNIDFQLIDMTDLENVRRNIKENTKAIYIETPSNPLLKITDISGIVAIAKEKGLITIADNTFMTPYLQRPLDLGVDIVVHSATKFLNGHSDVIAGLAVVKDTNLADQLYFVQNTFGAILSPQDSWLLLRGIKTLKVRLDHQQNSAAALSQWLKEHPLVEEVFYPGNFGFGGNEIHFSQSRGPGAVLSFTTKSTETALNFMRRINFAAVGVSLGGVETIVSYPVRMSHASLPIEVRQDLGITDNLIRVSVGLEDVEDLIEDFRNALR
ncbi:trans-sulfuration enzyme family protein [Clostridium thermarum]|uniref:trans-sulfuration enzyme family protein n=1 Tax=Clostridium thermarum TaxID=1716543 RepID=UPI0013D53EC8|nr:aminotransferase class V-fold PLP-dependent enzyme [Clostridium thermarum]